MFSVVSLTCHADLAILLIPHSVKVIATPSVANNAWYCSLNDALGSVNMRAKSSSRNASNSTRIGKRPCNSGIKSDGLATWKAPDAINNIWSVFTMPCLVLTVEPSINGNRSRCTPSRDTSGPDDSPRLHILSISSIKMIPLFSAAKIAFSFKSSWLINFDASDSINALSASLIFMVRFLDSPLLPRLWNMPCSWLVISSIPGGAIISTPT